MFLFRGGGLFGDFLSHFLSLDGDGFLLGLHHFLLGVNDLRQEYTRVGFDNFALNAGRVESIHHESLEDVTTSAFPVGALKASSSILALTLGDGDTAVGGNFMDETGLAVKLSG